MLVKLGKCKWAKHFQIFTFNRYELFRTSIILNSKENYYGKFTLYIYIYIIYLNN